VLRYVRINRQDSFPQEFIDLYNRAFPEEERVPLEELLDLNNLCINNVVAWYDGDVFVGITHTRFVSKIHFGAYLAVHSEMRGKGYEKELLDAFGNFVKGAPQIIPVESPFNDNVPTDKHRRMQRYLFYKYHGFEEVKFEPDDYLIAMKRGPGTITDKLFWQVRAVVPIILKRPLPRKITLFLIKFGIATQIAKEGDKIGYDAENKVVKVDCLGDLLDAAGEVAARMRLPDADEETIHKEAASVSEWLLKMDMMKVNNLHTFGERMAMEILTGIELPDDIVDLTLPDMSY